MTQYLLFNVLLLVSAFLPSEHFELGRLYHYSYSTQVDNRCYGRAVLKKVQLSGHIDVCTVWSDGDNEVLRVEFHSSHAHSKSGVQSDFAVAHLRGDAVEDVRVTASFSSRSVAQLLAGFIRLTVPRQSAAYSTQNLVVREEFDSSFGQHHPVSLFAEQSVRYPLVGDAISIESTVHAHLITTSECIHATVEGKDVDSVLETISHRTGVALVTLDEPFYETTKPPTSCSAAKTGSEQADCVAASNALKEHESLLKGRHSMEPTTLRRYYSNLCLRRGANDRLVARVISLSLERSKSASQAVGEEVVFGVSCLVNQACAEGQSRSCQDASRLVYKHIDQAMAKCASDIGCKLALVRALEAMLSNFPRAHDFVFGLATQPDEHPQIVAGCLRALGRCSVSFDEAEFSQLVQLFESSPTIEVRFAALDLLLSPGLLSSNTKHASKLVGAIERILAPSSSRSTEFGAYLSTRLRGAIAADDSFRKSLLSRSGRCLFLMAPSREKVTSFSVGGAFFEASPLDLTFNLDIQNSVADMLVHSSFSVSNEAWRLFEVEIDAVGVETLMDTFGGSTPDAGNSSDDVGASVTLKLSAANELGSVVARHADLFRGQDGIMSAMWNAPSDLTDISRVNASAAAFKEQFILVNGLSVLCELDLGVSVVVQGSVSISLWSQTAETLIATKVGATSSVELGIPAMKLVGSRQLVGATELSFKTYIALNSDGKPDVCLQMTRDQAETVVTAKGKQLKTKIPPVSYAFTVHNSHMCQLQLGAS